MIPREKLLNILKNRILVAAHPGALPKLPTYKAISKELDYKPVPAVWNVCPCDFSSAFIFEISVCFPKYSILIHKASHSPSAVIPASSP